VTRLAALGIACALSGPSRAGLAQLPARADPARDATGEGIAFVELTTERREPWVHERTRLRVRFGVAEDFLAERAVQPFRQRLDVPVQLVAPWVETFPGARVAVRPDETGRASSTLALNGDVGSVQRVDDRVVDGRPFRSFELGLELVAATPGDLELPAPVLALAYATRFEASLLDDRVAVDRTDVFVRGDPLVLSVLPLPEDGRPLDFSGAVGRVSLRAELEERVVRLGESLMLVLTIEGVHDPAALAVPRWRELGPFRVLGVLSETTPAARVLTLDLAPASERARQIPSLELPYFDPGPPGAYRTARTEPIDVVVRPAEEPDGGVASAAEAPAREGAAPSSRLPVRLLATALVVILVAGLLLLARRRA